MRSRNLQCQHMFQVSAPVTSVVLHPNQVQVIVGDQSGATHIWDLKTDHNVQFMPETGMARSSHPEVFLGKSVLKICSKFTGEHPCRSAISI